MLDDIKITFVAIVDNKNQYNRDLTERIWSHEKFIRELLKKETCIIGRRTFELTNWKGPKSWVLTSNREWRRSGIGTIHSIDDLHLFVEDDNIFVLGGQSLYEQMSDYVDEIHLYVFNNKKGEEDWIRFNMKEWQPVDYDSNKTWSYAKLERK
jgi:dihydrofolate reductase